MAQPEPLKITSSGDRTDDAVALAVLFNAAIVEVERLNGCLASTYTSNAEWLMLMKLVIDGHAGPQQVQAILEKKKLTGGRGKT